MSRSPRRQLDASEVANWTTVEALTDSLTDRGFTEIADNEDHSYSDVLAIEGGFEHVHTLKMGENSYVPIFDLESSKPPNVSSDLDESVQMVITIHESEIFSFHFQQESFRRNSSHRYTQFRFQRQHVIKSKYQQAILERLNKIATGSADSIQEIFHTRDIISQFRDELEELRTGLVSDVVGHEPETDISGDTLPPVNRKQQYVQLLLNRFIFLRFLQSKRWLRNEPDYLQNRQTAAKSHNGRTYEQLWKPLFATLGGEQSGSNLHHETEIFDPSNIPALDIELFSTHSIEERYPEIALGRGKREEKNLERILTFLGEWDWIADENSELVMPGTVTPAIVGHVFEESVNQAGVGAYHTPDELTLHTATETIEPVLYDQMTERSEQSYNSLSDVLDDEENLLSFYQDVLSDVTVVDPAVGTGGFLIAAQQTLLEIHRRTLDKIDQSDIDRSAAEQGGLLQTALNKTEQKQESYLKREILKRNLYGVDVDSEALQLCRLRLWLSILPNNTDQMEVSNLFPDFEQSIQRGNSLVGYGFDQFPDNELDPENRGSTDWWQEKSTADELFRDKHIEQEENDNWQGSLFHWPLNFPSIYDQGGFDVVIGNPPWDHLSVSEEEFYTGYIEGFTSMSRSEQAEALANWNEATTGETNIEERFEERKSSISSLKNYLRSQYSHQSSTVTGRTRTTYDDLTSLFIERTFSLGSSKSYIGLLVPQGLLTELSAQSIRMAMIDERRLDSVIAFENRGIFPSIHDQFGFAALAFKNGGETESTKALFGQTDLSILRGLREHSPTRYTDGGPLVEVPRSVLIKYATKSRTFPRVTSQDDVEVLKTYIEQLPAGSSDGPWHADTYTELNRTRDRDRFVDTRPENGYPVLGGKNIYQFVHTESDALSVSPPELWSSDQLEQDAKSRIRDKQQFALKSALYEFIQEPNQTDSRIDFGVRSQREIVNWFLDGVRGRGLSTDDVKLDSTEYRIAFRKIARSTDERTLIATIIPPGVVCHNSLQTLRPQTIDPEPDDFENIASDDTIQSVYKPIFEPRELLAAVGVFNSLAFDFFIRKKVQTTVSAYKLEETQIPHLTQGDAQFGEVWSQAARLNCYGAEFEDLLDKANADITPLPPDEFIEERKRAQARLDAAVFHAYNFERGETQYIIDNFHRVRNPRIVSEEYTDLVLSEFEEVRS